MKKLRHDLDFKQAYGDVPEAFDTKVRDTLIRLNEAPQTPTVHRRPYLRMAVVVALLLALTATAVAAVLSRTAEMYLGPHGLGDASSQIAVDMQNGTVSYAGQSKRLGNVVFTLDDAVWGEEDIYATGTYRVTGDAQELLIGFDLLPSHPYGDTGATYLDYAAETGVQLIGAEIFMDGFLDADGTLISGDSSFYSYEESEGVHRFGLMLFLTPEKIEAAREAGSRFQFRLTVEQYDESGFDPVDTDLWNASDSIKDTWILALPEE